MYSCTQCPSRHKTIVIYIFVVETENNLNKNNSPRQGGASWWKPGVEIFSKVSGWIAVPIVLALISGKALDTHFGTKPWIFLGLTGIAFLISSFGIVRVISKYMKDMAKSPDQSRDPDIGREI